MSLTCPSALEKIVLADLSEHMESSSSTTNNILSPQPQCLWLPKMTRWWFTVKGSHPQSHLTLWSHGLARSHEKQNPLISTITIYMTTKLGSVATYCKEVSSIKSQNPLITCFSKILWQIKTILSPAPQCLWPVVIIVKGFYS